MPSRLAPSHRTPRVFAAAARQAREADERIVVATRDITDNARAFATEKNIRLLHGTELAKRLPRTTHPAGR